MNGRHSASVRTVHHTSSKDCHEQPQNGQQTNSLDTTLPSPSKQRGINPSAPKRKQAPKKRLKGASTKQSKHGVVGILCALRSIVLGSGLLFVGVCFLQSRQAPTSLHNHSLSLGSYYHPAHPGMLEGWKLAEHNSKLKGNGDTSLGGATGKSGRGSLRKNRNRGDYDTPQEPPLWPVFVPGGDQQNNHQSPLSPPDPLLDGNTASLHSGHSFRAQEFQQKLTQWRQQTGRIKQKSSLMGGPTQMIPYHEQYQRRQKHVTHQSRFLTQEFPDKTEQQPHPQLSIPFWDQQLMFKNRNSWHLMVVLMSDDCFPHKIIANQPKTHNSQQQQQQQQFVYPSLGTLRDALQTNHADIIFYFPQLPQSTLFPEASRLAQQQHQMCQSKLTAIIQSEYALELERGQLQLVFGIVNPLPPRIKYEYHHKIPHTLAEMKKKQPANMTETEFQETEDRMRHYFQRVQLQMEVDYSLGLDVAYIAELVYQYGDLLFLLQSGTRLSPRYRNQAQQQQSESARNATTTINNAQSTGEQKTPVDYGRIIVDQYERYQNRGQADLLVRRFCYMSFLEQDMWMQLPKPDTKKEDIPPRYQSKLLFPTGIVMEQHGLYRFSMVMRSLLPYHKESTSGLMLQYCTELLWESQILQPVGPNADLNGTEPADYPPPLWRDETEAVLNFIVHDKDISVPEVNPTLVQQVEHEQQRQQQMSSHLTVPPWVTVDNSQLGPQRDTNVNHIVDMPRRDAVTNYTKAEASPKKKRITFVVPTATRPNGIKNQYVTYSLNQLLPLIRRDFKLPDGTLEASILLVICGNTQADLDDHEAGLWEYYGPEIKEGIVEIVSTNLDTYPSLHNLPDNYGDDENRLRWRSKQNLDVSSSFFAAKGKSDYIMLLEDDTGYRDKFTPTLKAMMNADNKKENEFVPDPAISKAVISQPVDDFRQHAFSQIHFGFGYSGVLIHDDDVLVYAVLHYVMFDEKPCDLLYVANYLQGAVLDQRFRWQLKKVLITHLGSVSSLKGKIQPVWGLKG